MSCLYKPGDIVQVKSFDDLRREFPLDMDGDIRVPGAMFVRSMKPLCGKQFQIKQVIVTGSGSFTYLRSVEDIESRRGGGFWHIVPEMVRLVSNTEEPLNDIDVQAWSSLL